MNFNWRTLMFGLILAIIDSIALPILKGVQIGKLGRWMLGIPIGLYALDPLIFYSALKTETLTVMNFVWDLMSGIIVTMIGLFYFKENVPTTKKLGIVTSFVSLFLLSYEGDGISDLIKV
jgi:drug/metabolite transporter (DMT)-like permease